MGKEILLTFQYFQAFSGLDSAISTEAKLLGNTAFEAVLNAQFLVQIGVFTAVPMIMGFILELGLLKVSPFCLVISVLQISAMQLHLHWISYICTSLYMFIYHLFLHNYYLLFADTELFRVIDVLLQSGNFCTIAGCF